MSAALELQDLSVQFHTGKEIVQAVRGVSLEVQEGEVLAIVGESGCGKSVLCKSVMKLLPQTAYIAGGRILVDGVDITDYREREMDEKNLPAIDLRVQKMAFNGVTAAVAVPASEQVRRQQWKKKNYT